jgi:hypothetical protein
MNGKEAIVVDRFSATHSRPWENEEYHMQAMNRRHSDLVKFSCHDHDYERVLAVLRRFAATAVRVMPRNAAAPIVGERSAGIPSACIEATSLYTFDQAISNGSAFYPTPAVDLESDELAG